MRTIAAASSSVGFGSSSYAVAVTGALYSSKTSTVGLVVVSSIVVVYSIIGVVVASASALV